MRVYGCADLHIAWAYRRGHVKRDGLSLWDSQRRRKSCPAVSVVSKQLPASVLGMPTPLNVQRRCAGAALSMSTTRLSPSLDILSAGRLIQPQPRLLRGRVLTLALHAPTERHQITAQ